MNALNSNAPRNTVDRWIARLPAGKVARHSLSRLLAGWIMMVLVSTLHAHFPILIHDADLGDATGQVKVTLAMGHPYELELEPIPRPESVRVLDGRREPSNEADRMEPFLFMDHPEGGAWHFHLEPNRGDTWIAVDGAPAVDTSQKTIYQEYVKVCVHRGRQTGWNRRTGQPLEILPLTRPYGLRTGMVFAARLMHGDIPVANTEIFFERLNEQPPDPKHLPPEPLITYVVRTDAEGHFFVAFPDPGWWVVGAYANDLGKVRREETDFLLDGFAGLWVRVEEVTQMRKP